MRPGLAALALLLVAGCVSPASAPDVDTAAAPSPAADPWGGFPDALVTGHDHNDASLHPATPTMEEVLQLPLTTRSAAEADLLGKDRLVVTYLIGGFTILDVSDPAAPRELSFTPGPGYVADVKASPSGNFVFLGVQLAGFTGIQAWNVAAAGRPVLAGAWPITGGCHMLAVHGSSLYCAPNDATVRIFEIVETPLAVALVPQGVYAPHGPAPPPVVAVRPEGGVITHDMTVQDDPLTGEPVMLVSFWDDGVHVVDVSDPARPTLLGRWAGEGADATWGGHVHTTMAGLVDGRRVVVTVPEYAPIPSVTFLDATDYGNMTVLGVWAPKADFGGDSPSAFSTHNFQFVGGHVYVAMYHGGVVVLDASTLDAVRSPRALGYLVPFADGPFTPGVRGQNGSVWDVLLKDGYIYATGMGSGLHVLRLAGDPVDPALRSFA